MVVVKNGVERCVARKWCVARTEHFFMIRSFAAILRITNRHWKYLYTVAVHFYHLFPVHANIVSLVGGDDYPGLTIWQMGMLP